MAGVKRGVDLTEDEDAMLEALIQHYHPVRPDRKRSETVGMLIRASYARLVRLGVITPGVSSAAYDSADERAGLT